MQALKGKTVALEEFSVSHFLLVTALTKNGMTPADVKIVNLSAGDAAAAFMAGRVDAATVWNPWVNQIELSGKGQALFTSKNIPGLIPDLLVVQEKSLAANRKDYLGMVKAWFDVVKFLKDKPDEAAKIMAKVVGMEPAEYKVFLPGTRFFGEKENLEAFGTASDSKSLMGSAPVILKFLDDNKLIEGKPDYAKALDASLVKEADRSRPFAFVTAAVTQPARACGRSARRWGGGSTGCSPPSAWSCRSRCWWVLSNAGLVEKVFMPTPGDVWKRVSLWWSQDGLLNDAFISIYRVTAGWLLSAVIALPLGMLIGTFRPVQALLEPLTDFIRYMPAVAFIPLVMLWIGHRRAVQDRHHLHRHVLPDGADGGRGRAARAAGADRGGADHGRDPRRDHRAGAAAGLPSRRWWTRCASPWAGPGPIWWWPNWWRPTRGWATRSSRRSASCRPTRSSAASSSSA